MSNQHFVHRLVSCVAPVFVALLWAGGVARAQVTSFPYLEDFELNDGGFVATGTFSSWEWGVPAGSFIPAAGSADRAWVTNLSGNYNDDEVSGIESPVLDCTGMTVDPTLDFVHIFEHGWTDISWVQVSINGGPFSRLGLAGDATSLNWYGNIFTDRWVFCSGVPGEWRTARHVMTGCAGNMVQLRWAVEGIGPVDAEGIGVDQVRVYETRTDVGASLVLGPPSGDAATADEHVVARIFNLGTTVQTGFAVRFTASGPVTSTATEMFTGAVAPLESAEFYFSIPADLSTPGEYTVTVETLLVGDEDSSNDTASISLLRQAVVSGLPYTESFESGPGMFITGGVDSSWEYGEPVGFAMSSAASGSNAWVTNLAGLPNFEEVSYLQSPPIDLTALVNDPFLQFSHQYHLDSSQGSWVELSIDSGPFQKLGLANDEVSFNWYSDAGNDWWDGQSDFAAPSAWQTARHLLDGGAGHVVAVRWLYRTVDSASNNEEGMGVDDFQVFEAPFGAGNPASPGQALLDVNSSTGAVGFSPDSGLPGPFYASLNVGSEPLSLHFEGPPYQPIILYSGDLSVGALQLPPFGQVDIGNVELIASGLQPGGLNPLFYTSAFGSMDLSVTAPISLAGAIISFQGVLFDATGGFSFSNAVQVTFLP